MSLFSFLRDVGARVAGVPGAYAAPTPEALKAELDRLKLPAGGLTIAVDGDTVHLTGSVPDAESREKIVLAVGNVHGVAKVDDRLQGGEAPGSLGSVLSGMANMPAGSASTQAAEGTVHDAAPQPVEQGPGGSAFYTVQKGDTLSAIARKQYGDANAYPRIFEANKPMLDHPDRIYPGQVLRIPPKG